MHPRIFLVTDLYSALGVECNCDKIDVAKGRLDFVNFTTPLAILTPEIKVFAKAIAPKRFRVRKNRPGGAGRGDSCRDFLQKPDLRADLGQRVKL